MTKTLGKKRLSTMNTTLTNAIKHWRYIAPLTIKPKTHKDYENSVWLLDMLLDQVGENERHPLMGLVDIVSFRIEEYESMNLREEMGTGIQALKYLMEQHELSQHDLAEVGSQGVVSEILNGKRKLNLRQIKLLARRLHVDVSTFIDD